MSLALAAGVLIAACDDSSLADLGQASSGWIGEVEREQSVEVQVPVEIVGTPGVIDWFNDDLGVPSVTEPTEVVNRVIERAKGERFVQASRFEIAGALPAVSFPRNLPAAVEAITSQLVVSIGGERLDDQTYAVFGMWMAPPYSKSRSVGQRGVLTVAPLSNEPACGRLLGEVQGSCSEVDLDGLRATRLDGESGQTWVWSDGTYEYQLFLRGSIEANQPDVEAMTSSLVALGDIPVSDDVRVLGNQVSASEG